MPTFVYSDVRIDWPEHVFPTEKYGLLKSRLEKSEGISDADFISPPAASDLQLRRVHTRAYLDRLRYFRDEKPSLGIYEFEAPCNKATYNAFTATTGGSILASKLALEHGAAMNIGGGFHHAFAGKGEGFCIINDIAVSIRDLQAGNLARRVAVLDCDVHQGNGTAKIFENDDTVFTFSIHQENNYPVKQKSSLDIGLPDGARDGLYLDKLAGAVDMILNKFKPDLVHYAAGADPYHTDKLGGLDLTRDGLSRRDDVILNRCRECGVPVVATLAGGYAENTEDVVTIHYNLAMKINELYRSA
ncbi:histone deacetylase [Planctomycetota bacterium]